MDYIGLVQWPAMLVTVIAAWYVSSRTKTRRGVGFWCFLASNVLWIIWGWHTDAYALIVLQVCLAAMNIRGARNSQTWSELASKRVGFAQVVTGCRRSAEVA